MQNNLAYRRGCLDELPEEIINGRAVMMAGASISHNHVVRNLSYIFTGYLKGKRCVPFSDGTFLSLSEGNLFIPDFMVVCDPRKAKGNMVHGAPDLVIEVLSPGTAKNDRGVKKDAYERAGVKEYWIINPADKTVEVYVLQEGRFRLDNTYSIYPDFMLTVLPESKRAEIPSSFRCGLFEDLEIQLDDLFDRVE